jgi:molybdenum cofactor cytidylyltransferase
MDATNTGQSQETGNRITAVLLAAGESRRMGSFKPLLPFGNTTVIESCIDYLCRGGVENVVVVVGNRGDEIRLRLKDRRVAFAVNPEPESEMADSISHGIQLLPATSGAVLISLTDQPAIPHSVVSALIERWHHGEKIVKPEVNGQGGHPVLIDLSFRSQLLDLNAKGGLREFLQSNREQVYRLKVDSPFIASDMDTWDDYVTLHREVFGFGPPEGLKNHPTR